MLSIFGDQENENQNIKPHLILPGNGYLKNKKLAEMWGMWGRGTFLLYTLLVSM